MFLKYTKYIYIFVNKFTCRKYFMLIYFENIFKLYIWPNIYIRYIELRKYLKHI